MKFLNDEQRLQIGFNFVMDKLIVHTPYGLDEKRDIKPFLDKGKLEGELKGLKAVVDSMKMDITPYDGIDRILSKVKDIRGSLLRCKGFEILDDVELFEIKYFCILIDDLAPIVEGLKLGIESIKIYPLDEVVSLLNPEEKLLPTFHIYESYSEKLKKTRFEKRQLENNIRLENDEDIIRELKKSRLELVVLEEEEELEIRKALTNRIAGYLSKFGDNIESLGRLDWLIAKGRLALEYNMVKPSISENIEISLEDMVNPEVMDILKQTGKSFTPISIYLESGTTIITGANMGGKSVALKTLELNLLLGQMGFFVFCKKAVFPVMDFIYLISDDMQSVSRGLSTFGAEIVELKEALKNIRKEKGIIALDEFARGTNPVEGRYLVKSLGRYLMGFKSISIISTHYDGVVEDGMAHYQVVGLKNINFERLKEEIKYGKRHSVEIIQEHMEYSLERVPSGSSVPRDALNICNLLGLENEITDIARKLYNEDENK